MPPANIAQTVSSLLTSEKYADLIIKCGERTFKVHKAIVCPQSVFLEKACDGSFKEALDGVINLPEDDPDNIGRLINYLYNADYTYEQNGEPTPEAPTATTAEATRRRGWYRLQLQSATNNESPEQHPPQTPPEPEITQEHGIIQEIDAIVVQDASSLQAQLINIGMYALAEKLDIQGLKALAIQKFNNIGNIPFWIFGMPDLLRAAYMTVPASDKGMKNQIARLCAKFLPTSDLLCKPYRQVLIDIPEAHIDILQQQLSLEQTSMSIIISDKAALANEKKKLVKEKREWQEEKALLKSRHGVLQTRMRQLETENARLATEKREAEDKLHGEVKEAKTQMLWGYSKFKETLLKVNEATCSSCCVKYKDPRSQQKELYYRRLKINLEDNVYYGSEALVVRCSGCNKTL